MGERGPAPRRDAERRRRNKPEGGPADKITQEVLDALPFEVDYTPEPPDVSADWHVLVKQFWDDMQTDPARKWMTSGDWAALALVCEAFSRELVDQPVFDKETGEITERIPVAPKSATIAAFLKMLEHVGVTESARLRLRKEVSLFPPPAVDVGDGDNVVSMEERRRDAVS
jgi:hypothetical protein